MSHPDFTLRVNDLRCLARLGVTAGERAAAQPVRFDVRIEFEGPPGGSLTDRLEQAVCYDTLARRLRSLCSTESEYRLIERLGYVAWQAAKEEVARAGFPEARVRLRAVKLNPPVEGLQGGASFECGDGECGEGGAL